MEKVPQSRFKGYQEEWLETQLSKITTRVNRKNEDLKSDRVLTISAQYGLIDQNDFFNRRIASNSIQGYFLMKNGEFAYNKSYSSEYPVGAVKRLKLYDLGVLSTLYILFSIEDESLAEWIEAFFESDKWHKEIIKRASEGARNHGLLNISPTDFFELPFSYPSTPEEQYKIAQFFSRLDTLIAAEDKKLAKLKNMKAASLEKMFPKAGETTPQVRFKGFKGEWVYKALKEIASNFEYGINAPAKSFDGINKYLRITDIDDDLRTFDKTNLTSPDAQDIQSFLLQEGDIVFARTGASVGKSYLYDTKDGVVVYAGYLIKARLDESVCHRFILYATLSARFSNFIRITSQRSGQPGVNSKEYGEYMFQIPPTKEEQIIIADFFSRLDTLISAQEQKLDKLRSLKKSFLEKMFVSTK